MNAQKFGSKPITRKYFAFVAVFSFIVACAEVVYEPPAPVTVTGRNGETALRVSARTASTSSKRVRDRVMAFHANQACPGGYQELSRTALTLIEAPRRQPDGRVGGLAEMQAVVVCN